ncbi:MAG: response regulator [Ignavibacteriaceae bacterium]|nr:response regulator [Ignavibacteriaceae bacterium]
MLNKLISEYALSELLEVEGTSYAIANKDGSILWFNKGFKEDSGFGKIKGRSFFDLWKINTEEALQSFKKNKIHAIHLPAKNQTLSISVLSKKNKLDGYFLRIYNPHIKRPLTEKHENLTHRNIEFYKELHDLLSLTTEETSLKILSDELLIRCERLTESIYSLIVFYEDTKSYNLHFHDVNEHLKNADEIEREIKTSFTFITKWLTLNKKPLLITSAPNSIGFNLANVLQSDYLLISPCFINGKLIAAIILAKKGKKYTHSEISYIEQLASFLSISSSGIKAKELNSILEQKLLQAQKFETIGKLSSGTAHDFNNLLSSIFGSLNLLKKRIPQAENINRLVDNIENCAVRARDLTKGILSFGKPTPKQKELIKSNLLITELSKVVNQTFPKEIEFNSTVEDKLDDILGNPTEIYQVLLNLCVNAKEAIRDNGKISLSAKNILIEDKNISSFPWLNKGKYVCFSVSDNGEGISEENIRKIFDPYFSTKKKETGSGLGLYVTYGIIKNHNGHIDVTSKINEGTTFDVYIPVYEPLAKEKATETSEKLILLADDEIMLRDLLAELLESSGFNVIKVTSGAEVLKVLTEEMKVDLLIIDYNMPGMNGLECVEQVRKLKYKMPIILSTGSLSVESSPEIEKIGVTSLVSKPYEFESMLSTIRKLI